MRNEVLCVSLTVNSGTQTNQFAYLCLCDYTMAKKYQSGLFESD